MSSQHRQDKPAQTMRVCEVCGQPASHLLAYPSGSASVAVVYDGAWVCSPECARAVLLERGRTGEEPESTHTQSPHPWDLQALQTMTETGELSAKAAAQLRAAMDRGADAYPYYSACGRANVWTDGRRYTAAEYTARAEQIAEQRPEQRPEQLEEGASPANGGAE